VLLNEANYQRVAHPAKPTIVSQLFQDTIGLGFNGLHGFENDPSFTINIWDSLTIAYLIDPTLATQTSDEYIDVDTTVGIDDGKTTGYVVPPDGLPLQKLTVVRAFDNVRFFDLYADLLTRPVPVALSN
jgi:purine nucleosidase